MKEFTRVKEEIKNAKPPREYGAPGSLMKTSDGRIYEVQENGSWRRYHGGPAATPDQK